MKKIAIYCRVSTIEQAEEGYSIDEQERLLKDYVKSQGYEVYKVYSDRGISGKNIKNRPALRELLKEAEEGKFEMVLTWKINRIARNMVNLLNIVDLLEKKGIVFKSFSENFETETPVGKLTLHMMGAVGEFERGTISQNVKMGMCARAREGRWNGGILLGYDLEVIETSDNKKQDTRLVINEREADIVRIIFNEYASGKGYKAITQKLNKEGYKTKKGKAFSQGGIKDILTNPTYIGKIRYNVRQDWSEKRRRNINPNPIMADGIHEAIIDKSLWDKVELVLKSKKGKPSRIYDGEYPLTGILRCPKCGAGMVISRTTNKLKDGTRRRISYYACGNWKNKGTAVCNSNSIRVDKANEYVFNKISELIYNEEMVKAIVENVNKQRHQKQIPIKKEIDKIDKELEKLDRKKKKLFEGYEDELITGEEFKVRKDELNRQAEQLEKQKEILLEEYMEDSQDDIPYDFVKRVLQNFSKILTSDITRETQKKLLHMIISEITINEAREVDSIKININDNLINYLKEEGVSKKDTPSSAYKEINVNTLNLEIAI